METKQNRIEKKCSPDAGTEGSVPKSIRRVICLSLNHKNLPTQKLGKIKPDHPDEAAEKIVKNGRITECVLLVTCNRVEVYASTRKVEDRDEVIEETRSVLGRVVDESLVLTGLDAVEHLARVASGLESMVLGEDEILGQVKREFERYERKGLAKGVLRRASSVAVQTGKKCRGETRINEGKTSYGSIVCEFLSEFTSQRKDEPEYILVVGGGKMARTVTESMRRRWKPRVDVANRSEVEELTYNGGKYYTLNEIDEAIEDVDGVVTTTSAPDPVIRREDVESISKTLPIVDLANPRDVSQEAEEVDGVVVRTLEDVSSYIRRNSERRRESVGEAESIIEESVKRFVENERENMAEDTLREIHRKATKIREREVERALNRLEESNHENEDVLEDFAGSLMRSILDVPTRKLREAARQNDDEVIEAAQRIFGVEVDNGSQYENTCEGSNRDEKENKSMGKNEDEEDEGGESR